jgi:hypothetical protein
MTAIDNITDDTTTSRRWILEARDNDPETLINGIKHLYNCGDADVDADGDIWIADPMTGHWLDADGLAHVARALRAGDI